MLEQKEIVEVEKIDRALAEYLFLLCKTVEGSRIRRDVEEKDRKEISGAIKVLVEEKDWENKKVLVSNYEITMVATATVDKERLKTFLEARGVSWALIEEGNRFASSKGEKSVRVRKV